MAHTPLTDTDNRLQPVSDASWWRPLVVAGEWSGEIVSELAALREDFVVPKYRWSAFAGTYLDAALRVHDVTTIVLAGGLTDIGIAATAFSAKDLDYNLVIPYDALTASERDNHDQLVTRIFPRIARLRAATPTSRWASSPSSWGRSSGSRSSCRTSSAPAARRARVRSRARGPTVTRSRPSTSTRSSTSTPGSWTTARSTSSRSRSSSPLLYSLPPR